ncbi:Efflux pump membrane transporter BepE [Planctomycetes bacterium Pan216]|uniref:Efflux pump membrane transporter BepE n=1 Tax=Kolteria novifilia TaxID=2527975 RepID=A0A518B636_9BACT|nr:Efflux pump membrane transporter BepE [Planctomycetes bacterium Pan216]
MFSFFFIDRPIFASVLSIVIVIIGSVALMTLPVAQYPEITPPTVQVSTNYPGANAKVVAETVATPIEQEVNGVEDMLYMSSQSSNDGQMNLTVTFAVGTDLDMAQVLVQNRVAIATPKLPEEVRQQGVTTKKKSPSITLCVNLISPDARYDQLFLSNYAVINIKDALARLDGVGDVSFLGARDYSMRIWLDPEKLASRDMTASDVINAVREQNKQVAAGRVGAPPTPSRQDFQYTINTQGRLIEEDEFGDIIIKTGADGQVTRLRDVARIELGAKNYEVNSDLNGDPSVTLAVFQLPGSNALETAEAVRAEMKKLETKFPEGLEYRIVYDTTQFVEKSIESVIETLFEAIALVFLVVLIFLQDWRTTVIPLLAVPVSLIGTFAFMAGLGFSLNNLSLFGLVLAIGVVVDDAIVVVENVERVMNSKGLSPRDATRETMKEIIGPVIATTLVLCAVFVPTAFITGISGEFYRQFALTIAVSTVISSINALTLTPALCPVFLRPKGSKPDPLTRVIDTLFGWFFRGFNTVFDKSKDIYGAMIARVLRASTIMLIVYAGLLVSTYFGFKAVPTGFIPQQDKGYLIAIAQLPDAATLQRSEEVIAKMTKMTLDEDGVGNTIGVPGYSMLSSTNTSNLGSLIIVLDEFKDREGDAALTADSIADRLRKKYAGIQEAQVAVFGAPPIDGLGSVGGLTLEVEDRGDLGAEQLQAVTQNLVDAGNAQPGLVGLFTTFRANEPQLFLDIDRTKAKSMGVPLSEVFDTLQIYLGSLYVNDFTRFGRNWQVNAQAESRFRLEPKDIGNLKVRNTKGDTVPLGTLVSVDEVTGPSIVNHYNLYPAAEINFNTAPGTSTGQAIAIMEQLSTQQLPQSMSTEWTGIVYQQILAGNVALLVFPLSVVFVFLTLAAQYESWSLPLAIILIVPMCLLSSIVGVGLWGGDNNIFTQIGFIVLVGLASKNAILIVEFAKVLREEGKPRDVAALEASMLRLRPILMTAFTFILGVLPLIVAEGAGAEMRKALGIAVFSGMLGVTIFGLFLTPVFYTVVQFFVDRPEPPSDAPSNESPPIDTSNNP